MTSKKKKKKSGQFKNLYGFGLCYSRAVGIILRVKKLAKPLDNISVYYITKLNC